MACTCDCAANNAAIKKTANNEAAQSKTVVETVEGCEQTESPKEICEKAIQTEKVEETQALQHAANTVKTVRVHVTLRTKGMRCRGYLDMPAHSKVSDIKPIVVKDLKHVKKYNVKAFSGKDVNESDVLENFTGIDSLSP
ncbi:hypothetical protein J3B02_000617 [Coemansia erecta]|nr:hypothetical protein J3B02_000617 [Coemansia erecta]